MRLVTVCCLTALWTSSYLSWAASAAPPVKVRLRSSWPAPNLFLEVLESASSEQRDTFFPLLDLLTSQELFPDSLASLPSEAIHEASVRILLENGYFAQPGALETFELSLALHAASPKIETFFQFYRDHKLSQIPIVDGELLEDCTGSWVDWYGHRVCTVDTLRHLVEVKTLEAANDTKAFVLMNQSKLLSFDHVYPPESGSLHSPSKTAILYASVTSPNFRSLHSYLFTLSRETPPRLRYVYRHVPPEGGPVAPNHLSGFGVTLDLKKMDYLALDDRKHSRGGHTATTAEDSNSSDENERLEDDPILDVLGSPDEQIDLTTPLQEEEISGIAIKSAQLVLKSPNPLTALIHLSQNFPKYATSVARRVIVDPVLQEELEHNSAKAQVGINMVWLNGFVIQESDINPFGFLRLLRKEREIIGQLTSVGLSAPQAIDLLTHQAVMQSQGENRAMAGIFDASDRPEEGGVIVWWNDLEKDKRYAQWAQTLHLLLRPVYPGQFHNIKRNMYNTVLLLDLSQRTSLAWITGPVSNIIQRGFPFRFGVVPLVETEEGIKAARLFYSLVETYGRSKTMGFLKKLTQSSSPTLDFDLARAEFRALALSERSYQEDREDGKILDFDAIIGSSGSLPPQDVDTAVKKARRYAKRLGATLKSSPQGHAFINGKHVDIAEVEFLRTLQMEIAQQTQFLQEQIYAGILTDATDLSTYFYDLPTTVVRRNRHIYPAAQAGSLRVANLPEVFARAKVQLTPSDFVYPVSGSQTPVSMWLIADFDEPSGKALLRDALTSLHENATFRLAFVHNPSIVNEDIRPSVDSSFYRLSQLRSASLLNCTNPVHLLAAFDDWQEAALHAGQVPLASSLKAALSSGDEAARETAYIKFRYSSRLLARELDIPPGQQALVVNGRLVGPIEEDDFTVEDFETLVDYELSMRVGPLLEAYTNITGYDPVDTDRDRFANDIALLSSIVTAVQIPDPSAEGLFNAPQRPRNRVYRLLDHLHSSFAFGDITTATYQFAFLIDPVSEQASRWSPLISWLSDQDSVHLELHLNPMSSLAELPLKQFYRYNLQSRLAFDELGSEVLSTIEFKNLPPDPIYTLGMDVPPAWLVRPHESHHDLDNIHLSSFTGMDQVTGVEALFDLDYLVVEGHARDAFNAPPRGLQLQLTTSNSTPIADTQVVANLGYLQFKVKPGVFQLEIRDGYGREVFELESVGNEGWNSPPVSSAGIDITLTSLEGLTLYPRFRKRPGMETLDVLAEPQHSKQADLLNQVVSRISSFIWPEKQGEVIKSQADINIFTVASGLLYERFVSIMILSVLRNTKSTVKFWFIENFLSPSFLEFIPHLAEAYDFQYELVTYKWPSWLRAQKEKQRVIWGYKILFLDVLFPMDLKKVIFVDADQIVRADLKELVDLDLHGAPYGYTPMGDDNTEMEGFRFWKTGYWKEFLRDKPYHISALYVIDLVRFRQLAAGDRLRGSYQSLSADPNSLSNLDQDLPNNLQHDVPIFSLPEDWLWCETWCSKDRLHRAKTIDLCQNPLTKEPKLSRARQIPEWEEYDTEIAQFARGLAERGVIRSAAYTGGADTLVNVGAAAASPPMAGASAEAGGDEGPAAAAEEGAAHVRGADSQTRDEL